MKRKWSKWWIDENDRLRVGRLIGAVLFVVMAVGYVFACGVAQSLDDQRDHGWWQLWAYRFKQDGAWFDIARTTATLVAIPGAAVALVIAFARQRISQQQVAVGQRQVTHAVAEAQRVHERELARHGATERQLEHAALESRALEARELDRRINEQYVQAVDQLRDNSAVARIAGMHALDRLAQDQEKLRSIVVDVWCAYLRIKRESESDRIQADEREVRATCSRLLLSHLRPDHQLRYWSDRDAVRIDLTGADLRHRWDAEGARFPEATSFAATTFGENPRFGSAAFGAGTTFADATFADNADFEKAIFVDGVDFSHATFGSGAWFSAAKFGSTARFVATDFGDFAGFEGSSFGARARFTGASFGDGASFDSATFGAGARFNRTVFGSDALFENARFGGAAQFVRVRFGVDASFSGTRFPPGTRFGNAKFGLQRARGDGTWWLRKHPVPNETQDQKDAVIS